MEGRKPSHHVEVQSHCDYTGYGLVFFSPNWALSSGNTLIFEFECYLIVLIFRNVTAWGEQWI